MNNLPSGYREVRRVDLMRNRKEALLINLLALVITALVVALGFVLCPPISKIAAPSCSIFSAADSISVAPVNLLPA